jgi:hypothetical protein
VTEIIVVINSMTALKEVVKGKCVGELLDLLHSCIKPTTTGGPV